MKPMSFIKKYLIVFVLSLISLNGFPQNSNPVINYNHFVAFLKGHYGLFPYKNINWDSLSTYYSRFVNDSTSSDSLFFLISRLAGNLRDKHLWIDNEKYAYNYSIGKIALIRQMDSIFASRHEYKNVNLIRSGYLNNKFQTSEINNFLYGKIGMDIGYLSLDWFDKNVNVVDSVMTVIINSFSDCNALIIDIRNNIGGTDSSALTVANHLVKSRQCYQISRIREGDSVNYYSDPVYWYINPDNVHFSKPVFVLINRYTISAAETFLLALKGQKHIRFLGEPTAGAFSDAEDSNLPNGWHFSYSIGVWTDSNGNLWEEKGIRPDIFIKETNEANNISDPCLDFVLKGLRK
jgi:carboxyl-terminal processing protease